MRVKELINALASHDPEALVYISRESEELELDADSISKQDGIMDANNGVLNIEDGTVLNGDGVEIFENVPYFAVLTTWS